MKTKLFTFLTLLLCVCSGAWGADIVDTYTQFSGSIAKDGTLTSGFTTFTFGDNCSKNSSALAIANNTTGTFTITTKTGYYIKSIAFTCNNRNGAFSSPQGEISGPATGTAGVHTFTPDESNCNSASFSFTASGGRLEVKPIQITITDNVAELSESLIPSSISSTNLTFTTTPTYITSATSSGSVSNGILSFGNNGTITLNSSKPIKAIYITWRENSPNAATADGNWTSTDSEGSYSYANNKWTVSNSTTKTVTLKKGWSSNSYISGIHVTYYPGTITVTYDANGGLGSMENSTGTSVTLSANGFTAPTGYSFAGWNTADDASGTSYSAGQEGITENLDLFATWTQNGTVNANTGSANTTYTATLNATSIAIASAPTKDESTLTGYWTAATGGEKIANADGTLVENTSYADENGKWNNDGDAPNLYAQWQATVYYTLTLNPNGGTIDDATGWILDNGQYKKASIAEGTEVELPTFTKTDCTLMTWRDDSDSEYSSPVTITSNLAITAIWGKEKERVIYSWEGASGGASQSGGTATHYNGDTADGSNTRVNYANTANGVTYYTISLNGKNDYSTDHIRIALSENIKTGDEVKVTAYYTKESDANASAKMNTQDGTSIFTDATNLPNIYRGGSPVLRTYTVPAGINTNSIKMTRNQTGSGTFITKLQIVRTEIVEEQDSCEAPTITTQPVGADYEWSDVISPLTVTASVSDGGTLSYQWYKKGTPNVEVGTNSSSYTPSEAGTYFVVVTNSKDGYEDASTASSDAVITITEQPAYGVTFSAGEGSGTVPTETDKVDGAQFTLPGQGSMVAPANKYFTGWNDGTDDYAEGTTYTMPAEAVTFTALWTALPVATANHYKYSYKDAQHYVNSTYRNPRGGIAVSGDNQSIPNGNLCESLGGITSVAITSAQYDGKGTHMDAYLKIATGGSSKVTITIASGYVGTLTLKANGYSANAGISVSDAVKVSGSEGGVATAEDNFNALVYTLYPGAHNITCSSKNMYISEMDIVTEEVTSVPVTVAESGWTSLASAYALDFANAEDASSNKNLKAYVISDITSSAVTLTSVESAPAETGLILKGTASTAYTIPVSASPASITTNELSAAVTATAVETESVYVVSGGELKLFTGTEIPAGKAYLQKSKVDAVGARSLSFIFDDETTGISNVENSQRQLLDGDFYNLAGQRVAAPAKGMYIVNGRKVVIK